MPPAPLSTNEAERLTALRSLEILDTEPDPTIDVFTELARLLFDVPISAVSLVAEDRQWFKSVNGLSVKETPRDVAFCAYAILDPDHVLHIPDAIADRRFVDNRLVTGDPSIRFYAGAPIVDADGHALGSFCVMDQKPRELSAEKLDRLQNLASAVSSALRRNSATRKLLELETLQRALDIERDTNEMQRRFIAVASHELRTPIAIIDSAAQRALSRLSENDTQSVIVRIERIRGAVTRMSSLVNQILMSSAMEQGQISLSRRRVDLMAVLSEAIEQQSTVTPRMSITLTSDFDAVPLVADPTLLGQVFANLLSNAAKYSGASKDIDVTVTSVDSGIKVAIRDHGLGIPETELPRIFTRFFRAGTSAGIPGTGMGLYICQQVVKQHGGTIQIASQEGQGTTVTVELPIPVARTLLPQSTAMR